MTNDIKILATVNDPYGLRPIAEAIREGIFHYRMDFFSQRGS